VSSLRSPTGRTPPHLSLPPFSRPTPPTLTQPRKYLRRSFVSSPRLLNKVTVDIVVYLQARFSSSCYHPTSQPKRPRPHSFRFLNLRPRSQAFRFKTLLRSIKISGAGTNPHPLTPATWSVSLWRCHLGCYRRISFRPINPEIWPQNCSRLHLICGTRESFPPSREHANLDSEGFITIGLLRADRFPTWILILWDLTLLGEIAWPLWLSGRSGRRARI